MFVVVNRRLFIDGLHFLNPVSEDAGTSFNDVDKEMLKPGGDVI